MFRAATGWFAGFGGGGSKSDVYTVRSDRLWEPSPALQTDSAIRRSRRSLRGYALSRASTRVSTPKEFLSDFEARLDAWNRRQREVNGEGCERHCRWQEHERDDQRRYEAGYGEQQHRRRRGDSEG